MLNSAQTLFWLIKSPTLIKYYSRHIFMCCHTFFHVCINESRGSVGKGREGTGRGRGALECWVQLTRPSVTTGKRAGWGRESSGWKKRPSGLSRSPWRLLLGWQKLGQSLGYRNDRLNCFAKAEREREGYIYMREKERKSVGPLCFVLSIIGIYLLQKLRFLSSCNDCSMCNNQFLAQG